MKKIVFIAFFLLAGYRASGQELGGRVDLAKKKGADPLSFLKVNSNPKVDSTVDTSMTACGTLYSNEYWLSQDNTEPQAYDSARAFLEDCPLYPNSWRAFSDILGDAQVLGGGPGGWPGFLTWLKSVLYLNPDTGGWYCNDVGDMLTAEQGNEAAKMSICQYILASGKCPALAGAFETIYGSAANARHTHWLDSIIRLYPPPPYPYDVPDSINADTLAHPFADTAVPTLFQDSLEILMGPQYAGVQETSPPTIGSQALLSAQLIENPIQDEIDISYDMGRTALVTMELRDILGRSVPLSYAKYQLEQPGDHTASISAPNLPAGIYYLRITTDVGDAITLKIVKE